MFDAGRIISALIFLLVFIAVYFVAGEFLYQNGNTVQLNEKTTPAAFSSGLER